MKKKELSHKLVIAQKADSHFLEKVQYILELAKNVSIGSRTGDQTKRTVLDINIELHI